MYYTYVIRCEDNSLYTGITTDLERRMKEHFEKNEKCAKYTFRHNAKKLEMVWTSNDRKLASTLKVIENEVEKIKSEIPEELSDKAVEALFCTPKDRRLHFRILRALQNV